MSNNQITTRAEAFKKRAEVYERWRQAPDTKEELAFEGEVGGVSISSTAFWAGCEHGRSEVETEYRERVPQPIETAPKDRIVLVYRPARKRWNLARWEPHSHVRTSKPYWASLESFWGVNRDREEAPTHWCELPPAPDNLTEPPCSDSPSKTSQASSTSETTNSHK